MKSYKHITVDPIAGSLGAEIGGVNLQSLIPDEIAEIKTAFLEHQAIFFRDQPLDNNQLKNFTRHFGDFGVEPYVETMSEHPEIIGVIKEADETKTINFGGQWHSDWSFQENPPMATILHGRDIPPYGGDTVFANMYLAYETLPDAMKQIIDPLIAVHSARRPYGTGKSILGSKKRKSMTIINSEEAHAEIEHPLVRIHPETGKKCLFVNEVYTIRIKGMSEAQSKGILDPLFKHATREEFTCRFRWRNNSLAMWDNRCAQHLALNDYDGYRRALYRTTVAGDRPYGEAMPL